MNDKKILVLILVPVQGQSKNDDTIRSKSNAGNSYAEGWERTFKNNANVN